MEKAKFYLAHDDMRLEIAENGYSKVKQFHTYEHRVASMLQVLLGEE